MGLHDNYNSDTRRQWWWYHIIVVIGLIIPTAPVFHRIKLGRIAVSWRCNGMARRYSLATKESKTVYSVNDQQQDRDDVEDDSFECVHFTLKKWTNLGFHWYFFTIHLLNFCLNFELCNKFKIYFPYRVDTFSKLQSYTNTSLKMCSALECYFIWFKISIVLTCLGTLPSFLNLNLTRNSPSFPVGDPLGNGLSGIAPTAINRKLQIIIIVCNSKPVDEASCWLWNISTKKIF